MQAEHRRQRAIGQRPRPAQRPIAAASHMPAPVVRFRTLPRSSTIMPAARKATPAVTASTRRIGSMRMMPARPACISIRCSVMSAKRRRHADRACGCAGRPRGRLASRSKPITAQSSAAPTRRSDDDRKRQDEPAQELLGQHLAAAALDDRLQPREAPVVVRADPAVHHQPHVAADRGVSHVGEQAPGDARADRRRAPAPARRSPCPARRSRARSRPAGSAGSR